MYKSTLIALFICASFLIYSCDEQDADKYTHEHFEPTKWVFQVNNENYLEIDNGIITNKYNSEFDLNKIDAPISLNIKFFNKIGDEIFLHEDNSLTFLIEDESILSIIKLKNENQNFDLIPNKIGETKITFFIKHGDHIDITSPEIQVKIK